ncbi:MAG: hypothetical protein LBQ54_10375 [Planctomycetaceae bacterium]|nr:hypothetical protein [Planctomycetaceae bacterium]
MPQNAVNDAVNKILEQNPDEKSTSLQDEAARFYNEAVFLYENKLYDQAAKYIETAYALNPENEEYRDTLLEYLFEDAYILLMQNVTAGYADRSFLNKDPIKTKRSISVFRRAFDIYSREQKFMTLSTTRGPQTMDYNRYLNVIMHIPQDIYPEWISDREKIFQQVFDDWINVRYPRLKDSVYDQKSFSLWASPGLVSPPERIRNYAPLDVVANCYETFFRDLFAFQKQYQMNPDNVKPILDQFQKFAIYVLSLDNVVDQRFYGPIERPIWQGIAGFTGSLPVTTKPSEREKSLAEASIRRTFTLISGQGFDIYVWVTELRVREQHRRTTVHTEEERNELANACIQEIQNKIMSIPDGIESRDREILSKMLLERKEMLERIMGTKPPEKQPETPNEFLAARELPVQNAPWKEKRLLSHLHIHPSLHARNDTLVVFEDMYDNGETVKPHLFNLKTFEQTTLPEWKIEKSENSQVGKSSDVIRGCDLDDKNIYVSRNGHGIFIFPRDGGRPTVINTKNGLPHNFIQSFAVLKDKLYAGVGLIGAESWFVEVDLQTQKVTLLSSSLGKTGTAPFFNLSPPPRFHKFTPDPKHHRILFTVQADNENPKNGLWTVDENKTFEQILAFETFDSFFSDRLSISPDGKYLFLVSYKGAPALFDLEIKKQVQLDRLNNQWLQKLQSGMNPPAFSPREFYRGWSYGLISLDWEKQCLGRVFIEDPTRIERLDIVCSRPYYAFGVMLAVPNGIVVIGDPNQFFFLRFE